VARHRRPLSVAVPPELLTFRGDDWVAPGDEASWQAVERWKDARRAFSKAHPDSELGTVLDQLRFERLMRRRLYSWS
jgi:hypothetical protein